jgi:hypothetical protein
VTSTYRRNPASKEWFRLKVSVADRYAYHIHAEINTLTVLRGAKRSYLKVVLSIRFSNWLKHDCKISSISSDVLLGHTTNLIGKQNKAKTSKNIIFKTSTQSRHGE